jgi:hypothetical protein
MHPRSQSDFAQIEDYNKIPTQKITECRPKKTMTKDSSLKMKQNQHFPQIRL